MADDIVDACDDDAAATAEDVVDSCGDDAVDTCDDDAAAMADDVVDSCGDDAATRAVTLQVPGDSLQYIDMYVHI